MRPTSTPAVLSMSRLGLIGIVFILAMMTVLARSDEPPAPEAPADAPDALQPARNPERLHLLLDSAKVVGWISGTHNRAGEIVTVTVEGRSKAIKVRRGNVFIWPYRVSRAGRIRE